MVMKQTSSPRRLLKRRPPVKRLRNTCRRVMLLTTQRGTGAPALVEGEDDLVVMLEPPTSSRLTARPTNRESAGTRRPTDTMLSSAPPVKGIIHPAGGRRLELGSQDDL